MIFYSKDTLLTIIIKLKKIDQIKKYIFIKIWFKKSFILQIKEMVLLKKIKIIYSIFYRLSSILLSEGSEGLTLGLNKGQKNREAPATTKNIPLTINVRL